jgi:hemin uptake protein HemP
MFCDGTLTARTLESVPCIHLELDHNLRDLVARLLSALADQSVPANTGICDRFRTAGNAPVASATTSPTVNASLSTALSVPALLDPRGRLHVSHNGSVYRLRFWTTDEWDVLPFDARPVVSTYESDLECWLGLEPAPPPLRHGTRRARRTPLRREG